VVNQLYVDGPRPELTAAALTAELDRGLADAGHRRATITDDATGRALEPGMRSAGYSVEPLAVMLLDREPPEPEPGVAREIDEAQLRALVATLDAATSERPEDDRAAVAAGHAHLRASIPGTRRFAGFRDGVAVAETTLYAHDGVGQPESVGTHPDHRGHGVAAATVSLATREALASGSELVFILCNVNDGPFPLYARLGFRAAGRYWTFNRQV
jgi:predicted GNAT family acetyltransferase